MIKAIVFDLGGVYFSDGTKIALEKMFPLLNVSKERLEQLFHGKEGFLGGLFYRGKIEAEDFWKKISEELGISLSEALRLREIWYSSYVPNKGMNNLLQRLSKNYPLIVFSGNTKERVEYLEERYHFKQYFDAFVFSFDVGGTKKDKIFYEALLKQLNDKKVLPGEVVAVDNKERPLEIAASLGMKTVLFKDVTQLQQDLKRLGVIFQDDQKV